MGCLFAIIAGCFPRLASLIVWLARPTLFSDAFGGSWFVPLLGILLLPFTTLMYVLLWSPAKGVAGWDWFWLGLAVLLDLAHWASAVGARSAERDRVPVYTREVA